MSTDDPSSTHFVISSKNIRYLLSMVSLLETHIEIALSSYFNKKINQVVFISLSNSLQITDVKLSGV